MGCALAAKPLGHQTRRDMRNKIFTAVLLIIISSNYSNAQLIHSYGIKTGIVQASETWDYFPGSVWYGTENYNKSRIGFDFGGYVEWFNIPIVSVLTEIHYVQKGAKDELEKATIDNPDGTGEYISLTPRIDYLSLDFLAKLRYETPILTFYGLIGPRIDFLLGRNEYARGDVFKDFKTTEFGINIGGGMDFPIALGFKIGANVIYNYSPQYSFTNQYLNVKNHTTEFLLTIGF